MFIERLSSIEDSVKKLLQRVNALEVSVQPDVVSCMLDKCKEIVSKSKADMNLVIEKNGYHLAERVRAVEAKAAECMRASEAAAMQMGEKLAPIEYAVKEFNVLEGNMSMLFDRSSAECDSIRDELRKRCDQLSQAMNKLDHTASSVSELVLRAPEVDDRLERCEAFVNKYETRMAVLETTVGAHERGSIVAGRQSVEVKGCIAKVSDVADELSMLAFNVASAGVTHDGIATDGDATSTAWVAAKLMRKRSISLPPRGLQCGSEIDAPNISFSPRGLQ